MASILKVNEIQHTGGTSAMTVDTNGIVGKPNIPAFRAYSSSAGSIPHATFTIFDANVEFFDNNNDYDTSTYQFTAPINGIYRFYGQFFMSLTTGGAGALYINGAQTNGAQTLNLGTTSNGGASHFTDGVFQLTAGDTVEFRIYQEQGSAVSYNQSNTLTWWMGYLIG